MDRPEWTAVNPLNGDVYLTLTHNGSRTEPNAPNPRIQNRHGHIVRWHDTNDQMLAVIPASLVDPQGRQVPLNVQTQGELRRIFVGPNGCEATGLAFTPDNRTMFVNIQHPANWPYADDGRHACRAGRHPGTPARRHRGDPAYRRRGTGGLSPATARCMPWQDAMVCSGPFFFSRRGASGRGETRQSLS